ncbi:MAG: S-methyl-5'-thioadenosine phosphorylase, partial [Candidatus Bathyarchaeia archaeon]
MFEMIRIAVIGGTGLEEPLKDAPSRRVETPFGPSQEVRVRRVGGKEVLFMARHGPGHEIPPHRVNYRANIWALKELGVERIVSTNAVGAINPKR